MGKNINGDRPTAFPLEQEKLNFTIPVTDQPREKVAKLVQTITDRVPVKLKGVKGNDPEYWGLAAMVTDEMADVALKMGVRKPKTIEQLMTLTKMEREPLQKLLDDMAWVGLIEYNWENLDGKNPNHEKRYVLPQFVPGSAEFFNMRRSQMDEHPEVAAFFERMTFLPLEKITPMVPPGGAGIGMVTRDGLSCPVGHYAINPVPRTAIFREAALARREAGMPELPLRIEISIPSGRELAEKTFNPHLGIIGGISVLGTTGIVNPMSEAALVETIRLDIRVHAQEDVSLLAVAPGNYGERFLKEETGLSMENFIKCSNFIGTSFKMLSQEGIHQALLAGHVGKLVKVAGGVMNTHSRYGDRRMEILSACARTVGFPEADALLPMNTTEEAADFLYEHGYLKQVMEQVANQVKAVLEEESGVQTEVMLFSSNYGLMARTAGADAYVRELLEMERGVEVMID